MDCIEWIYFRTCSIALGNFSGSFKKKMQLFISQVVGFSEK